MKSAIAALLLSSAGMLFGTQGAFAQTASYTWNITNTSTITVGQFDVPTQTGLNSAPFISPFSNIGQNGTATATETTKNAVTGTSFVGAATVTPVDGEFECAFTITNSQVVSNGQCTQPSASATATHGTSSTRPKCGFSSPVVDQSNPCHFTVNFTFGFQ
jgi:hypothetical protein